MCVCMQFPALGVNPILIKSFLLSTFSSYIDDVFRQCDWNMSHYLLCVCVYFTTAEPFSNAPLL